MKQLSYYLTNKEFSKKNKLFIECCEAVNIQPTKRQASKFRYGKGQAFIFLFTKTNIDHPTKETV